jgi:hypothetical protein
MSLQMILIYSEEEKRTTKKNVEKFESYTFVTLDEKTYVFCSSLLFVSTYGSSPLNLTAAMELLT